MPPTLEKDAIMRFRFSIRDILWLTLMVALAAGWFVDHKRLTPTRSPSRFTGSQNLFTGSQTAQSPAPAIAYQTPAAPAVAIAAPVSRNPHNEVMAGYNAVGVPVYIGPRGGIYHYDKDGGKVYYKNRPE